MFFTCVLKSSKDGRLYKGYTNDLERRLNEHNNGYNRSTKYYRPWELVYYEELDTIEDARSR